MRDVKFERIMEFIIANQKYFKEFDGSDNSCCWQIEAIGHDIESVLDETIQDYESMYEDWGVAYTWRRDAIAYSIMCECVNTDQAHYRFLCEGFKKRFFFGFERKIDDSLADDLLRVIPRLESLGERT